MTLLVDSTRVRGENYKCQLESICKNCKCQISNFSIYSDIFACFSNIFYLKIKKNILENIFLVLNIVLCKFK